MGKEFTPLVNFRSTTMGKAFLLNGLVIGLIAGLSIEVRALMDVRPEVRHWSRGLKVIITTLSSAVIGILVFIVFRVFFSYGGGMLAPKEKYFTFLM